MMRRRTLSSRSAFTLLEVLLALALGGILIAAIWTGLGMFWKYSEAGRETSDQLQIARAVFVAFQRDLRAATQPDAAANATNATSSTTSPTTTATSMSATSATNSTNTNSSTSSSSNSTSGSSNTTSATPTVPIPPLLVGDSQSLVFQAVVPQPLEQATQTATVTGAAPPPRRDLQWIGWSATGKLPVNLATQAVIPPPPAMEQSDGLTHLLRWQNDLTSDATSGGATAASVLPVPPEPIPEVRRFLLHYYDGIKWYDNWDSDLMSGLPIAVEIEIEVASSVAINAERESARKYKPQAAQTRTFKTMIPLPLKTSARQYPEEL